MFCSLLSYRHSTDRPQIAESFRRFGITDFTQHVLAVKVGGEPEITADAVELHLKQNVEGEQVAATDDILSELLDLARVKKIYKLNSQTKKGASNSQSGAAAERSEMETFVLGSMALKGS